VVNEYFGGGVVREAGHKVTKQMTLCENEIQFMHHILKMWLISSSPKYIK